jgi:hypothetical protein
MMYRIRYLAESAPLAMTLVAAGLVLYLAAPRPQMRPILHPVGCHACSCVAPPEVVAAKDAELVRIGAIEIETDE